MSSVHAESLVVDACILPSMLQDTVALQRIREGGFDCVFLTVAMPDATGDDGPSAGRRMDEVAAWIAAHSDVCLARSVADIRAARAVGHLAVVFYFQDPRPFGDDLRLLETFHDRGLRVLQMAYNAAGYLGAGCAERTDGGLTFFGLEMLAECSRLGILVDVSHCGDRTTADTLANARGPVVATHANARAVCANPRNKPDDHLRAIAASGGVIGLNMYTPFVTGEPKATLEHLLRHLDHLLDLVGEDHIGLGLDSNELLLERPGTRAAMPLSRRWRNRRPDIFGAWGDFRPSRTASQACAKHRI